MTQEDKELLLKDLCARLPYGVKADFKQGHLTRVKHEVEGWYIDEIKDDKFEFIKLYLRPISSMTEEEAEKYNSLNAYEGGVFPYTEEAFDWLNANHFDYRNLIHMGLALEASEDMYKTE